MQQGYNDFLTGKFFKSLNSDSRLVVGVGGKGLGLLRRDHGVPLDESGHHSACSLNTHGKRSKVQEKEIRDRFVGFFSQNGRHSLIDLFNSFLLKKSKSNFCIFGMQVEPPTRTSSCMADLSSLALRSAFSTGSRDQHRALQIGHGRWRCKSRCPHTTNQFRG